jgi:hypothetical protein
MEMTWILYSDRYLFLMLDGRQPRVSSQVQTLGEFSLRPKVRTRTVPYHYRVQPVCVLTGICWIRFCFLISKVAGTDSGPGLFFDKKRKTLFEKIVFLI